MFDKKVQAEALILDDEGSGHVVDTGLHGVIVDDEPGWKVPANCPECGARVDQSTASFAEHPACAYCAKPLPCQPAYTEYY
jgi:hypothetical protein